jgi:hypothetical protein
LYTCLLLALVFAERGRDKARAQHWLRFVGRHRVFLRRPTKAAQWDDQHRLEAERRDIEACYEDYRGWVYYLDGHPSKARHHIEAAVKLNANAEWLYHLAWLIRLLPNREVPPDVEITEDMMRRKSVGCRCEDCPGDRTHRVVSRVICDTYCDLSPQRGDLFCEKILGANQPRHENKICRTRCHDAVAPAD